MTAQEASEQAQADVQTSDEGQESRDPTATHSIREAAEEIQEEFQEEIQEEPSVPETLDPKAKRKSDREWQESQEKAKKADELSERVARQDREIERLRFERDNPIALELKDELDKLDTDPRWKEITWEERLAYVRKSPKVSKDVQSQRHVAEGSIAPSGSAPVEEGISNSLIEEGASWFGSPEKARELAQEYKQKGLI